VNVEINILNSKRLVSDRNVPRVVDPGPAFFLIADPDPDPNPGF
jgi:hypothetical protein